MKLRKQIRGYKGLYQVRSDGAIISMPREKRLPNGKTAGGYRWEASCV